MEELYYININGQSHFIHEHIPEKVNYSPFIFLNPIFDEKKRSQKFYAETARKLSAKGSPVIRFDYYGTGDSEGDLFELNLKNIYNVVKELIKLLRGKYSIDKVNLLGLRLGADIALSIANKISTISKLILIEPIVIGKLYLNEQRLRRKIFFKLHNIENSKEHLDIDGETYEDHQGYPISMSNLDFLNDFDSTNIEINNFNIFLFKLNTFSSKKNIEKLTNKLENNNNLHLIHSNCNNFWSSLEVLDTNEFSEEITINVLI